MIEFHAPKPLHMTARRLGQRLRDDTRALHVDAERSPFMAALLRGRMGREAYASLLGNLQAIYEVLEPALARHAAHPALAPLDLGALAREASLRKDLATLGLPTLPAPRLCAAASHYAARLRELDGGRPELLLAHAYVRYLGDLSGGQLLRDIVARSPGLAPEVGTSFYDFGDAASVAARAAAFREGLDAAVVDDPDAVVAEARQAFVWHRQLFDELAEARGVPY
jgi:heme oxygenase